SSEHERSDPEAHRGERGEQSYGPSADTGVDLLRQYDQRNGSFGARENAREHLTRDEEVRGGRDCRESGEKRVGDDRVEQQPAASEDVSQRRYKERPDVAEADQRQQIPQGLLGNL